MFAAMAATSCVERRPSVKEIQKGYYSENSEIAKEFEKTYFEAQVDYAEGRIKIKELDGLYEWAECLRVDGKIPIYQPIGYTVKKEENTTLTGIEIYEPVEDIKNFIESAIKTQQPGRDSLRIQYKINPGADFDTIIIPKKK